MFYKQLPALFAIVCITTLGALALSYGINGAVFVGCLGAIAGLGGYTINRANKQ